MTFPENVLKQKEIQKILKLENFTLLYLFSKKYKVKKHFKIKLECNIFMCL